MKSIYAVLLTFVLSLLLVGEASAMSDRGVAKQALQAHSMSYKKFQRAQLSPAFISAWETEAACINEMFEGVDASSMSDDDKTGVVFSLALLGIIDYSVAASKDKPRLVRNTSAFLVRKSDRLVRRTEGKRGNVIARSLRGHARAVRFFLRGENIDFCAMRDAVGGTYTIESVEAAFETALSTSFLNWLENSSTGDRSIAAGVRAMSRVRPKLNPQRVDRYGNAIAFGLSDAFPEERVGMLRSADLGDVRSLLR